MGRHRRSAAGRAATGRATGVTGSYGSYTGGHDPLHSYGSDSSDGPTLGIAPYLNTPAQEEAAARSAAYLFATDEDYRTVFGDRAGFTPDGGPRRGGSHRRPRKKAVTPVRTGLLGVSAAVALGTVAVATGGVPGLDNYKLGGSSNSGGDNVAAAGSPTNAATEQGGTSGSAERRDDGSSTSRDVQRSASPTPSASASTAAPTKTPSKKPQTTPSKKPTTTPDKKPTKVPRQSSGPVTVSAEKKAAAEVLKLVNEERAKVGCSAVSANSALADLAEDFSNAMAARGFFDHTDPNGATPWDRADKAGIAGLGGENIARGQSDAASVMEAWMNSPGHKANILNCDFKTLGVGVHLGPGGPWWTQDFGY
ncbi:CAP domain-containing protein [Streptomyces luteolifulvus]|uniref:CAP domain-containing protein n=1 Tax=Streptomyces luteolifulvus TaxID=2615112 RepID=A0A6H9UXR5_9ACTN|nr:CAP domain-containing protein [Streptomyces luteolifulvus]KAB1143762.1 CAP domain-containing protein [Streptomyces luteolifulvus]